MQGGQKGLTVPLPQARAQQGEGEPQTRQVVPSRHAPLP